MTSAAIEERLHELTQAFTMLADLMGAKLTRAQLCNRLGIHRNTLKTWEREGRLPTPGADGRWLLSEVVQWEQRKK